MGAINGILMGVYAVVFVDTLHRKMVLVHCTETMEGICVFFSLYSEFIDLCTIFNLLSK